MAEQYTLEELQAMDGKQATPEQVAANKPRIQNDDNSVSTERSITIGVDGGFVNIPTIVDGEQLSNEQAIAHFKKNGESSPVYKSQEEAVSQAKKRSDEIGAAIQDSGAMTLEQLQAQDSQAPEGAPAGDTPDNPRQDISPFDSSMDKIGARWKTGFGNTKGSVGYLKRESKKQGFSNVQVNSNGDIVIEKNGDWIAYDPSGEHSPWDVSEVMADMADVGKMYFSVPATIAGMIGGGSVGTTAGPGMGTVIGAVAGHQAAGIAAEEFNQSLGRWYGTYDATPQEVLTDHFVEFTFNLLGLGFGPAVKTTAQGTKALAKAGAKKAVQSQLYQDVASRPTAKVLGGAVKKAANLVTSKAKDSAKRVLNPAGRAITALWKAGTGIQQREAENFLIHPIRSMRHVDGVINKMPGATVDQMDDVLVKKQVPLVINQLRKVTGSIKKAFVKEEKALLDHPDIGKFNSNLDEVNQSVMGNFERLGLVNKVTQGGDVIYEAVERADLAKALTGDTASPIVKTETASKVGKVLDELIPLLKQGPTKGREGAKRALQIKRKLDSLRYDSGLVDKEGRGVIAQNLKGARDSVANSFKNVSEGLDNQYMRMNNTWMDGMNTIREANRLLKNEIGSDDILPPMHNFVKKLNSPPVEDTLSPRDFWDKVVRYNGADGNLDADAFLDINTARQVLHKWPHVRLSSAQRKNVPGFGQNFIEAGRTASFFLPPPLSGSPRLQARTVQSLVRGAGIGTAAGDMGADPYLQSVPYFTQLAHTIKGLPKEEKTKLLQNPDTLLNMVDTTAQASSMENQAFQEAMGHAQGVMDEQE